MAVVQAGRRIGPELAALVEPQPVEKLIGLSEESALKINAEEHSLVRAVRPVVQHRH